MTKREKEKAKQYKDLHKRPAQVWRKVITEKISPEIQPVAGRVVWWDFFSGLPAYTTPNEFKDWLNAKDNPSVPTSRLCDALVEVGYPRHRAIQRLKAWK